LALLGRRVRWVHLVSLVSRACLASKEVLDRRAMWEIQEPMDSRDSRDQPDSLETLDFSVILDGLGSAESKDRLVNREDKVMGFLKT